MSQIRHPVIDCIEQGGGVTDFVAQKEHVSLPEHQGPGGVGLHHPGRVPDSVAHPLVSHQAVTDVTVERCCGVVLKLEKLVQPDILYISFSTMIDYLIRFCISWELLYNLH